jgi:hypothetical protein
MEAGFSTPLLDLFRHGDVDHDVRLLAARGTLAPRIHERLALLILLLDDEDAEIAKTADDTLNAMPKDSLAAFLSRSDVTSNLRSFFAARGIEPAPPAGEGEPGSETSEDADQDEDEAKPESENEKSTVARLASLTVAQRVVRAMKGSREERAVLIRDPNKLVSTAVLSSPKLTETEVEAIARMANVSEDVLRIIGRTRAWVKSYAVAVALAKNPKSPVAMSMNLLSRLTDRDLRMISIDRNVPDVVRQTARRKVVLDK